MVDLNTSANLPVNIDLKQRTNHSIGVDNLRTISHEYFGTRASESLASDFTSAFYGGGPYSLEHPNNTTEYVAQNCDYLA